MNAYDVVSAKGLLIAMMDVSVFLFWLAKVRPLRAYINQRLIAQFEIFLELGLKLGILEIFVSDEYPLQSRR